MRQGLILMFLVTASVRASAEGHCPTVDQIKPDKSLVITNPLVIDSALAAPGGPWHFSSLMEQMLPADRRTGRASNRAVAHFILTWLKQWQNVTQVNGYPVTPRPRVNDVILCPWVNRSTGRTDCRVPVKGKGTVTVDACLDDPECAVPLRPDLAPFQLLAVVNRLDLRAADCSTAGEGRFVFGLLAEPTNSPQTARNPLPLTVIFEYHLPADKGPRDWARRWHRLDSLPCDARDCSRYQRTLLSLTRDFSGRGRMGRRSDSPNGNPLSQLRTNDVALALDGFVPVAPWELREFVLRGSDAHPALIQTTVKQTPDFARFNDSSELRRFVEENRLDVLKGTHVIPEGMLGGVASESTPGVGDFVWQLSGVDESARFGFSVNTCNGCHRENRDVVANVHDFYHISPFRDPVTFRVPVSDFVLRKDVPENRVPNMAGLLCHEVCPSPKLGRRPRSH